jgi:hypothetical protein
MKKIFLLLTLLSIGFLYCLPNAKPPKKLLKHSLPENYRPEVDSLFSMYCDFGNYYYPKVDSIIDNSYHKAVYSATIKAIRSYVQNMPSKDIARFVYYTWVTKENYPLYFAEFHMLNSFGEGRQSHQISISEVDKNSLEKLKLYPPSFISKAQTFNLLSINMLQSEATVIFTNNNPEFKYYLQGIQKHFLIGIVQSIDTFPESYIDDVNEYCIINVLSNDKQIQLLRYIFFESQKYTFTVGEEYLFGTFYEYSNELNKFLLHVSPVKSHKIANGIIIGKEQDLGLIHLLRTKPFKKQYSSKKSFITLDTPIDEFYDNLKQVEFKLRELTK